MMLFVCMLLMFGVVVLVFVVVQNLFFMLVMFLLIYELMIVVDIGIDCLLCMMVFVIIDGKGLYFFVVDIGVD